MMVKLPKFKSIKKVTLGEEDRVVVNLHYAELTLDQVIRATETIANFLGIAQNRVLVMSAGDKLNIVKKKAT